MRLCSLLLCAFLGCAPTPPPHPVQRAPLPRSSVAAIVAARSQLELSDVQVGELEAIDSALAKESQELRERLRAKAKERKPPETFGESHDPGMAGMGRGPGGKGRGRGEERERHDPAVDEKFLERQVDDQDTQAFLQAQTVLRESQKERAREIAERYREQLFDEREAQRRSR